MVKEVFLPLFKELNDCINIASLALKNMSVNASILDDSRYNYIFSVEEVNKLVLQGVPFREAYKLVGAQIENGEFQPEKTVEHTHEGSIGNLCLGEILAKKQEVVKNFNFKKIKDSTQNLLI